MGITANEAEALDAWAWLWWTDRPWHHTSVKGYRYDKHAPDEHYLWQYLDSLGLPPRWLARALWPYMGTEDAKWVARKISHNRTGKNPDDLFAEKTASKIRLGLGEGSVQKMSRLVLELKRDEWTTARQLRRAGMMSPADLEGMTAEPIHRNTIRKRLDNE